MPIPKSTRHYIPSMICLTVLPVICMLYLLKPAETPVYHSMEVTFEKMHGCCLGCEFRKRTYIDFELTGDHTQDQAKLDSSRMLLRKIHNSTDSTIVHISLSNTATYGTYVMALNIFHEERINNYVLDKEGIWFGKNLWDRLGREFRKFPSPV